MFAIDEARIQALGGDLLSAARQHGPWPGSLAWFDDRGMAWTMADAQVKAALFRFVDALPNLRGTAMVMAHMREYLLPVADRLPWLLRTSLQHPLWPIPALASRIAYLGATRLAHRFIAGATPREAEQALVALRQKRLASTLDLLGEAVLAEEEADHYAASYHAMLSHLVPAAKQWADDDLIDGPADYRSPRINISLKLSALTSRWDPLDPVGTTRRVGVRLRPLLVHARAVGAFVNIDMEHHAYKDLTLAILRSLLLEDEFRTWKDVGVAIQAYLRTTQDDLAVLGQFSVHRGVPLWIRLVKGAYWDYETVMAAQRGWPVPVFTRKSATDAQFEACTRLLFTQPDAFRPAIAGHNVRSIAHALACAEAVRAPRGSFEFQMLYGMVDPLKAAVTALGQRVRVYAPFGELLPGMAYLVRRLLENTSNTSFVAAGFLRGEKMETLLMPPDPQTLLSVPSAPLLAPLPASSPVVEFRNEPLRDFSQAAVRHAWDQALQQVRSRLPISCAPVVAQQVIRNGEAWAWQNPSRLTEVVANGHFADAELTRLAITTAHQAWPTWQATPVENRARCLEQLAEVLAGQRDALAALILIEVGKDRREADADVAEAIDFCRYYAAQARTLFASQRRDVPGELNEVEPCARGVAAIIAPWNFPLAILTGMAVANLVVGNPILLKPAEQACAVGQALHECMLSAGFPPEVCAYLPGRGEIIGPILLADPRVAVIAFTGSRAVGLHLAAEAVRLAASKGTVTKVVAEMGGKNAIIIDADADLDEAVQGVLQSAFSFQGQKCSACSRVIVLAAIHDRFVERLAAAVRSLTAGPADHPGAVIGPVIDDEAVTRLQTAIAQIRAPLRIAAVGPLAQGGRFVAPVVVTGVPADHPLAQEELFGPVLAVIAVPDLEQALRVANATPYALTGGCFSRSPATLARVRREFLVGNLYLNRAITGALVDRQPFGGFRLSGLGNKAGGVDYLRQFVYGRTVTENTLRHGFAVDREGGTNA